MKQWLRALHKSGASMSADWNGMMDEFHRMPEADQRRAINKAQMEYLIECAGIAPRKEALDLGFGTGFSSVSMAMGGCSVTAVNYEAATVPRRVEAEQRYKRMCGRPPVVVEAATDRALPRLLDQGRKFGLIFIDAGHRVDDVFIDVHYSKSLCVPGGILVLDDTYYAAIRVVCEWVMTNLGHIWEPYHVLKNSISWKRTDADEVDWTKGIVHRSQPGPPKSFDVPTENAAEFLFYPGPERRAELGFELWQPKLS
jgi:predicted O-methyltransferase YrrM